MLIASQVDHYQEQDSFYHFQEDIYIDLAIISSEREKESFSALFSWFSLNRAKAISKFSAIIDRDKRRKSVDHGGHDL